MDAIGGQHGVARRVDVAAAIGEYTLRCALRDGVLVQPWRGVIMVGDRALDPLSRSAAALLVAGEGAVISRGTAAAMFGCGAAETTAVHVTVPYSNWVRSRRGIVIHHDRFAEDDVEVLHGLPVLSLAATITELLCTQRRPMALACLDQALAIIPTDGADGFAADIRRRLDARDDRKGTTAAESLLCLGSAKSESPQESKLRLKILDAGFPMPTPQYEICTLSGRLIYRLDLAWPNLRIGLEYDGYEAHEERADYDAERDRRMSERGWIMIRASKDDIREPATLLGHLRDAFAARGYKPPTGSANTPTWLANTRD